LIMACCGQARSAQRIGVAGRPAPDRTVSRVNPGDPSAAYFQYTGRTGVTVVGGATAPVLLRLPGRHCPGRRADRLAGWLSGTRQSGRWVPGDLLFTGTLDECCKNMTTLSYRRCQSRERRTARPSGHGLASSPSGSRDRIQGQPRTQVGRQHENQIRFPSPAYRTGGGALRLFQRR
jgi:hypothetical protein